MTRTYVITGAASGIGAATAHLLVGAGHHVVGVDRHDADVCADLSTPAGRVEVMRQVDRMTGGHVDAVIASAGTTGLGAIDVRVDYFGAVATLDGLRPLLARASAPRAVAVVSFALVLPVRDALVEACLDDDEERASRSPPAYRSWTRAWCTRRRSAPSLAGCVDRCRRRTGPARASRSMQSLLGSSARQ